MKNSREKPHYHGGGDWSEVNYGENLGKYLPYVPGMKTDIKHWFFVFDFPKYHPRLDLYVFYVKNDLKKINMENIARFDAGKKPGIKIIFKRILILEEFKEYCSSERKNIREFLFQPVYKFIVLSSSNPKQNETGKQS